MNAITTFTNAQDAHDYAYDRNVPFTRIRNLHEMNAREIQGLRLRGDWVIGIETEFCYDITVPKWNKVKCEFITLDSFRVAHNNFAANPKIKILGFYCYQLHTGKDCIIHLEGLKSASLDKQLFDFTGDGFGSLSFFNEGDESKLSPGGVIVHRKSNLKFYVTCGIVLDALEMPQATQIAKYL